MKRIIYGCGQNLLWSCANLCFESYVDFLLDFYSIFREYYWCFVTFDELCSLNLTTKSFRIKPKQYIKEKYIFKNKMIY